MTTSDGKRLFFYLVAGIGIGTVMGLLFAPRSGEETREYLRSRADEGRDPLMRQAKELSQRAGNVVDRGKEFIRRQYDSVGAAIEAGRRVYWQEKQKSQSEDRL